MTPKELALLYETIEHASEHFYLLGKEHGAMPDPPETPEFKLSKSRRLQIKTAIEKATKTR